MIGRFLAGPARSGDAVAGRHDDDAPRPAGRSGRVALGGEPLHRCDQHERRPGPRAAPDERGHGVAALVAEQGEQAGPQFGQPPADLLAERGAVVIDADVVAREVVAPWTEGLARVAAEFGPEVVGPDGELDRAWLAAVVFTDAAARARLNGIVHPLIAARTAELTAAAPPGAVLVHDVPLLAENNLASAYD